jgi:glycosyltransferase involved in cell wall biosynthesis
MRVIHYNHTDVIAGAERVLLNALPYLEGLGLELLVLSPSGALHNEVTRLGFASAECSSLKARFTLSPLRLAQYLRSIGASIRELRQQFQTRNPDMIHANSVRAGIVATLATIGMDVPVVWHVHDMLPRHPFSPAIRTLAALSRRTNLIAVSRATGDRFAGGIFRRVLSRKTTVLHNVAARGKTAFTAEQRAAMRTQLGMEGRFAVVCAGQICPRKNQIALVEAFAKACRQEPRMALVIVGSALFNHDKPYEQKLRERVSELGLEGSVLMLGQRNDVPLLLQTMDLLALPSRREPFAMILLEAMDAGLPIVAAAVDGVPELLADGRTGWLVPPGDWTEFARSLVWAARHPEQREDFAAAAHKSLDTGERTPASFARRFVDILHSRVSQGNQVAVSIAR